jgi:hypothetical protein
MVGGVREARSGEFVREVRSGEEADFVIALDKDGAARDGRPYRGEL